jgi:squalene synthase HpnC
MTSPTVARTDRWPEAAPSAEAVLRKAARENFPVAARFFPPVARDHLLAIYGYARLIDDIGDEAPDDRLQLLDWAEAQVDAMYAGTPTHPLMRRLAATVRRFHIPSTPLRRLIQANRQDQTVTRYETFGALLSYCELSANPVGHMVLYVFDAPSVERFRLSDRMCTGLQLAEHWQDVGEDLRRGRLYLPLEDLRRFGCSEDELLRDGRRTPAFRRLMAFEVGRARAMLREGLPLARDLRGRRGLAVAAFAGGGLAALRAVERSGFDVLREPPRASHARRSVTIARAMIGAAR